MKKLTEVFTYSSFCKQRKSKNTYNDWINYDCKLVLKNNKK